jgi:mannose-6-phosphate isomerase-like protein (cupin superfamily)
MPDFAKESDAVDVQHVRLYDGKGLVGVRQFPFGQAPKPANFVVYVIPPHASEGVHVHGPDESSGAYDEYYYVVSGRGRMEIDGRLVTVSEGDHIHTPMGVRHGIENTDENESLKVFLTYIRRDPV